MKKGYSIVLSLLMVMTLCVFETGCSEKQVQGVIDTVAAQLPNIEQTAANIATLAGDPQLGAVIATIQGVVDADLPILKAAITAYYANKSSGNVQAIIAVVDQFATSINAQVLAANKITNAQSEKSTLNILAILGLGVNGLAIALAPFAKGKTMALVRGTDASYAAIREYMPREEKEKVANSYGVSLATAEAFGL